jgi:hypothetical protein
LGQPKNVLSHARALGDGKPSSVTEYIQGYFRKRIVTHPPTACA